MEFFTNIFNTLFFIPFLNILMVLVKILGGNMGLAIIALTILFKLATLPLNLRMLKSQRRMQMLRPKIDKLKAEHGSDRAALAQAQMELYKAEGVSPTGGCLPLLLQLPFLFGIYAVFRFAVNLTNIDQLNDLMYVDWLHISSLADINMQFLWVNLAKPDPYLIMPLLAAGTQFLLSKLTMMPKKAMPKPASKQESSLEDSLMAAQGQMIYLFPIMTFFVTWHFPAGLALYWTVGNLFSIGQQYYINRSHPVVELQSELDQIASESVDQPSPKVIEGKVTSSKPKKKKKKK